MTSDEPASEPIPEPRPRPKYTPPRKKVIQKAGEFLQTPGTGTSGLNAVQIAFGRDAADPLFYAAFITLGLVLVAPGIYLQGEAER